GIEGDRALLDCRAGPSAVCADNIETAMRTISGAKVIVVGMKRSGVAAMELLLAKGARVVPVDQQPVGEVGGIAVQAQVPATFEDAALVVLSPGVPADLDLLSPVRARG